MSTISEYIAANRERFIDELIHLLRHPSVSADSAYSQDVLNTAQAVAEALQEGAAAGDLAFVIVPSIVAMPTHLDEQIIAVGVIYQFEFFAGGRHIHSWQVAGLDFVKTPAAPSPP